MTLVACAWRGRPAGRQQRGQHGGEAWNRTSGECGVRRGHGLLLLQADRRGVLSTHAMGAAIAYAWRHERSLTHRSRHRDRTRACALPRARRAGRDRRAAGQSRHARRGRRAGGAALSQGIPVRPAGDREPGARLAARAQRHHPADPAAHQSQGLPQDLERRAQRIPAQDHHPRAGREARRRARAARPAHRGRLGDALRQSVDRSRGSPISSRAAASASWSCRSIRNIPPRPPRPSATRCSAC